MAASVCPYTTPTVPLGSDAVVIVSGAGAMVRVRVAVAVCAGDPESVTLKVNEAAVTGKVGVPLMSPLDAFSDNPVGKVPEINCHACAPVPPVAASVCEYATPA